MLEYDKLEKYAELAVRIGVNIQKGQTLYISAALEAAPFVRKITEVAYNDGAKNVVVDWFDDEVNRIRLLHAPEESLSNIRKGKLEDLRKDLENGAAMLTIHSPKPDYFHGVETKRITAVSRANNEAMHFARELIRQNKISWLIVAYPTTEWAKKVFPHLPEEEAMQKLWECIEKATRLDATDPVERWQEHLKKIEDRVQLLNNLRLKKLSYRAPGTALTIELPKDHLWVGAGQQNEQGVLFVPNLPTEEVFTVPLKTGVNGVVSSTRPLSYNGQMIDRFSLTFREGKVTEVRAETGEELLKSLVGLDEGAAYLGEVALVPHTSPISQLGAIFHQTLFDENASCHLALGFALPFCLRGGTGLTREELAERGINQSMVHVDFMIGSSELDIDGENWEGKTIPIFRNGDWVI
ncbi:aminopeptidase [Thermoactinomyces daqus]|uniref:Aminopeptidase n=1 Tax=Thermoactinomyces daqus TaxID=1329516 RepID=A0A7W2AIA0_9BACL|nr:aminopeptidase [Thermoactinomyces daqus]MBA4543586.1 aminopeptidase [Thermoactinomyces daqus]